MPADDRLIVETLECLRAALRVSGAMFYWLDRDAQAVNDIAIGVPQGLPEHYSREMQQLDPLQPTKLVRQHRRIAELEREAGVLRSTEWRRYRNFLSDYRVTGNMDFVFWSGAAARHDAYAGISLLRLAGEAPFAIDREYLSALYRYVDFNLRGHSRVRARLRRSWLRTRVGLTAREEQVCELLALGRSNRDIAEALDLTLATVKTYVRQVFDKTGADTRTLLTARLAAQSFA